MDAAQLGLMTTTTWRHRPANNNTKTKQRKAEMEEEEATSAESFATLMLRLYDGGVCIEYIHTFRILLKFIYLHCLQMQRRPPSEPADNTDALGRQQQQARRLRTKCAESTQEICERRGPHAATPRTHIKNARIFGDDVDGGAPLVLHAL